MKIKKTIITTLLASTLAIGAGSALAQDDTTPPAENPPALGFRGPRGGFEGHEFGPHSGPMMRGPRGARGIGGPMQDLVLEYTGLDQAALREAHLNGQTLAELIEANGQSVDDFIAAAVAQSSERIDQAVANERITQEQADTLKAEIEARITAMVNGTGPVRTQADVPTVEDADA